MILAHHNNLHIAVIKKVAFILICILCEKLSHKFPVLCKTNVVATFNNIEIVRTRRAGVTVICCIGIWTGQGSLRSYHHHNIVFMVVRKSSVPIGGLGSLWPYNKIRLDLLKPETYAHPTTCTKINEFYAFTTHNNNIA